MWLLSFRSERWISQNGTESSLRCERVCGFCGVYGICERLSITFSKVISIIKNKGTGTIINCLALEFCCADSDAVL